MLENSLHSFSLKDAQEQQESMKQLQNSMKDLLSEANKITESQQLDYAAKKSNPAYKTKCKDDETWKVLNNICKNMIVPTIKYLQAEQLVKIKQGKVSFLRDPKNGKIFRLEKEILGRGFCGEGRSKTKKAYDENEQVVLVKVVRETSNEIECKILDKLDRLVSTFFAMSNKHHCVNQIIVQKFIAGETLEEIDNLAKQEFDSIKNKCKQQLAFLHEQGIVHGSPTPDNIIYNRQTKKITFIDFGQSAYWNHTGLNDHLNIKGKDFVILKETLKKLDKKIKISFI